MVFEFGRLFLIHRASRGSYLNSKWRFVIFSWRIQKVRRVTENPRHWPHLNPIFPYFFIGFLTIIYKKPCTKNKDFWSNLPNWIDFRLLPKIFQKIFSAIFGPFAPLSNFFDLSKLKIYLKTSIFIQRKILETHFRPPNSTFSPQLPPPHFSNFVVFLTYVTQFKWAQNRES